MVCRLGNLAGYQRCWCSSHLSRCLDFWYALWTPRFWRWKKQVFSWWFVDLAYWWGRCDTCGFCWVDEFTHQCTTKRYIYLHHTNTLLQDGYTKISTMFFRKNRDEMLGEISEKKHWGLSWSSSTMLPCGTSSRPHRRVIFSVLFRGSVGGEVPTAVFALPGRTLPSFQMKRSRKRRKRRHRCGQWNLSLFFEDYFFFVFVGNFGGVSCWRLGVVLWVVLLVEVPSRK